MKSKIYFVRHAQSDFSVKDELLRPLTPQGIRDAQKATKLLKRKKIHAVYSSPCVRSIDTIRDYAERFGYKIVVHDGFAERKIGQWIEDFHSFSVQQWEDFSFKLNEGESLQETQERNISALQTILLTHPNENVIIATHGTALATIVNYYYPNLAYDYFVSIVDKMPYILCLTFNNGAIEWMEELEFSYQ